MGAAEAAVQSRDAVSRTRQVSATQRVIRHLPEAASATEQALREMTVRVAGGEVELATFQLWGTDRPNTEVAGEAYHRDALAALYRPRGRASGTEFFTQAQLVPELMADHPEAVRVDVEGHTVGYLAHGDGGRYRPALAALFVAGLMPTVPARVWADNSDGTWRGRVTLALDDPGVIAPANDRPGGPTADLPAGRSVKVTLADDDSGALSPYLGAVGRAALWVVVSAVSVKTARSEKRVVEVRVDGLAVGTISQAVATGVLPILDQARALGRTVTARGYLSGNSLDVRLSLSLMRADELPDAWVRKHLS